MRHTIVLSCVMLGLGTFAADPPAAKPATMAELLAGSQAEDWRRLDPENTLYLELPTGRVIIELAPDFAPAHIANVKALARERYYDGLAIVRSHDNYVVQLGDPDAENQTKARKIQRAKRTLPPEFETAADPKMTFTPLGDRDVYAPETGFCGGFPVARDTNSGKVWLVHCYGMVGSGRDADIHSGGGPELYVVTGHSPRHLDRNVTLFGRVIKGIELLSALPRGTGALGFYEKPEQRVKIKSVRVAADLPASELTRIEVLRTERPLFQGLIAARRNRSEPWFHVQAGHVEICNVPIPTRPN